MKLTIGVLIGGKSSEHKISLLSGKNVVNAIDRSKYEVSVIYIDPRGKWYYAGKDVSLKNEEDARLVEFAGEAVPVLFSQNADDHLLIEYGTGKIIAKLDVLYPVLHGNFGEDGSV